VPRAVAAKACGRRWRSWGERLQAANPIFLMETRVPGRGADRISFVLGQFLLLGLFAAPLLISTTVQLHLVGAAPWAQPFRQLLNFPVHIYSLCVFLWGLCALIGPNTVISNTQSMLERAVLRDLAASRVTNADYVQGMVGGNFLFLVLFVGVIASGLGCYGLSAEGVGARMPSGMTGVPPWLLWLVYVAAIFVAQATSCWALMHGCLMSQVRWRLPRAPMFIVTVSMIALSFLPQAAIMMYEGFRLSWGDTIPHVLLQRYLVFLLFQALVFGVHLGAGLLARDRLRRTFFQSIEDWTG